MTWSWQRDLALPLGQALMESVWLYTVVVVVGALVPVPLGLSVAAFVSLSLTVALTAKAAGHAGLRTWLRMPLQLCLALLALSSWLYWMLGTGLPSTPNLATALGLGLYLTCRGLLIGTRALTGRSVGRWMIVGVCGLLFLFTCLTLPTLSAARPPINELRSLVVSYFIVGLATMSLAHRQATYQGNGLRPQTSLAWAVAVVLPILAVVSLGTLLVSGRAMTRAALEMLTQLGTTLTSLLGNSIALLLSALVWLLRELSQLFSAEHTGGPGPGSPPRLSLPPERPRFQVPPSVLPGAEFHFGLAIAALAVLAIVLYLHALARAHTSVNGPAIEEQSSAWSWALSRRQILAVWRSLLGRLRRRAARATARIGALRPRRREALGDIRQIYRALLRWAAEHGRERPPHATPHEFAAQLVRTTRHLDKHIVRITTSYARARYGTTVLDDEQLEQARQSIESLRSDDSEP